MKLIRTMITAALAASALSGAVAAAAELGPEIAIATGSVRGMPRDPLGVLSFKGIPFATPPVGALRWRAPQPVRRWSGTRDAASFGNRCLTAWEADREPGPPRSEDCLTLNVWTVSQRPGEKRPVMVWIHGGGFQFGSSASPQFGGAPLSAKGVVVVTLNYRVGVFGFLAHPDLDREGPSGDYGLQDQLAALRWIKVNIARFGGDPANVTIFGESAGAHAIGILMASPLSKGLFHKAIGASGAFWDGRDGALEGFDGSRARGVAFARRVGASSIAAMRAMPATVVNAAALWNFSTNPAVTAFSPNVDHYVVPEVPAARFVQGRQMHVSLLAGWNEVEQFPFDALGLPHRNAAEFRAAAERMVGPDRLAEFLQLYPANTDAEANAAAGAFTGDIVIGEQTWQWLELQRKTARAPVFGYKFTYTSPYTPIASHITDVPFVFGTLTPQFIIGSKSPPSADDRALSDKLMAYWVNFAAKGDPNGPGLPVWPAYEAGGLIQELGTTIAPRVNPQLKRFRFIASFRNRGVFPTRWRYLP